MSTVWLKTITANQKAACTAGSKHPFKKIQYFLVMIAIKIIAVVVAAVVVILTLFYLSLEENNNKTILVKI